MSSARIPIAPCPFCGNPRLCIGPRWSGPVKEEWRWNRRLKRKTKRRTYGTLFGYEIFCGTCTARIFKPWDTDVTKISVRRALASTWNNRPETSTAGGSSCPLCGSIRIQHYTEVVKWSGHAARIEDAVRCADCNLALIPGYFDWQGTVRRTTAQLETAWRTRQGRAEWELLHDAIPPRRIENRLVLSYDELLDMLDGDWNPDRWYPKE